MQTQDLVGPVAADILAAADEIESRRALPDPLMERLVEAGLFSIYTPAEYGGLDLPLPAALEVVEEVARLDGSTGWTIALGVVNGLFTAALSEAAAATIFKNGSALVTGAPGFGVRAEAVDGGYVLTGQWPFCSGARNASWMTVAAPVFDHGEPRVGPSGPVMVLAFMPPHDVEILDTWHVTGLRGTGTHDLRVKEAFVPGEMTGGFALPAGPVALRPRPLTRIPIMTAFCVAQSPAVCLGIARRAVDEFRELALTKESPFGGKLGEQALTHSSLARAEAAIRSARAYWAAAVTSLWQAAGAAEVSLEERTAARLAALTAVENSVAAVDALYRLAGSSSLFASSPLDRCWRDVHAAAQHIQVQAGRWETSGRVLLGMDPASLIV